MDAVYQHSFTVNDAAVDCFGRLKPSTMLFYIQEVSGIHGSALGADYDTLAAKNLFWAILRTRVQITRLPRSGETIRLETWPMPTTRVAYPRSVVAYDEENRELFRAISLWVMMDKDSRAMVIPGKSGITVEGLLRGSELAVPGSLAIKTLTHTQRRQVTYTDLDRNGHMNNTRYMEWINDLLPSAFHRDHCPREFTIYYHSEAFESQVLDIHYEMKEGNVFQVDAWRSGDTGSGNHNRVFMAQVQY